MTSVEAAPRIGASAAAGSRTKRVLFLAQLPPPVHGQSAMAKATHDALRDGLGFDVKHRWSGGAATNDDIGRRSLAKYVGLAGLLARLCAMAVRGRRHDIAYLGIAPWAHTAMRDVLLAGLSRLVARRIWVHLHGEGLSSLLGRRDIRGRLARTLLSGTELIAVTGKAARAAERTGVFARVFELPNVAADPGPMHRAERDHLVVSCLCNLDPRKGVFDFVEAIAAAVERGVPVRGVIAGGGTVELGVEELRSHVEGRGLGQVIDVVGRVDPVQRSRLLGDSDVFLYPSRHDLAPLVLIEALAHGSVPLVLDIGGLRDMVGPALAGNVFDSGTSGTELAAVIAARLAAYQRDRVMLRQDGDAARARYLRTFSPDIFRRHIEALARS